VLEALGHPTLQFEAGRALRQGWQGQFRLRDHKRDVGAVHGAVGGNGAHTVEGRQLVAHPGEDGVRTAAFLAQMQGLRVRGQGLAIEAFPHGGSDIGRME